MLVRWNNLPDSLATWEDAAALKHQYPNWSAWGQAVPEEEGDVTTPNKEPTAALTATGPRRGPRPKKSNTLYPASEWAV